MAGLLPSDADVRTGTTKLSDWLKDNAGALGLGTCPTPAQLPLIT